MTTTMPRTSAASAASAAQVRPGRPTTSGTAGLGAAVRFELVKVLSQWRIRIALLACWIVPALFVVGVQFQSTAPSDTVFGRWVFTSGWSGALVILATACTWILPLLASLVAGDAFAMEDRLGTWRHLLMGVRSPRRVFAAKTVATLVVTALLVLGLAASSILGGVLSLGATGLIGLDGHTASPGEAAGLVCLAWGYVAVGTLAYVAVGLLGSVLFGRSPTGLLLPVALAFVLQLVQVLPLPLAFRLALPSQAFLAWRGLFVDPAQTTAIVVAGLISLAWTVVVTGVAYRVFLRRDFTDLTYAGTPRRALSAGLVPVLALLAAGTAAVAVVAPDPVGTGIARTDLESSLATTFGHLYRLQSAQLGRPDVTEEQLGSTAACTKGGVSDATATGPGTDWRCVVSWHIPGATAVGQAVYQLDVAADGRYIADGDGPTAVNGYFPVRTPQGDQPNPLWQIDGLVDLFSPASTKG